MKKMLITGASGFLGSRIVEFYKEKYDIIAPSHAEMDITNEESVRTYFETYTPDIVVHCAAMSDVGQCEREPERSWRINVDGSVNVAKASVNIGAKCILCSSDQVYIGSNIDVSHDENEVLNPSNYYGQGKLKAERECIKVNSECVLLRLSWMYDGKNLCVDRQGDFLMNLVSKLQRNEEISYAVYDKRGITDVYEVIENLEKTFSIPGGVYNFGSSNDKNTYESVCEIVQNNGYDISIIKRNEEYFKDNSRNLTMNQCKINSVGIYFSTTIDRASERLKEYIQ